MNGTAQCDDPVEEYLDQIDELTHKLSVAEGKLKSLQSARTSASDLISVTVPQTRSRLLFGSCHYCLCVAHSGIVDFGGNFSSIRIICNTGETQPLNMISIYGEITVIMQKENIYENTANIHCHRAISQ